MTDRATTWSLTINNPTPSDEEAIALARQKGWRVEGQLEKGKEGTEHYQLMVKTPQVRFAALKKAFPRAHIEVARNVQALQQYVTKQDTRLSELPTTQEKYPSLSKFWELIYRYFNARSSPPPPPGANTSWCTHHGNGEFTFHCVGDDPKQRQAIFMYMFDDAVSSLIRDGYYVESLASNPQVRNSWLKYHKAILFRTHTETDRQTDNALESAVEIPCVEYINGREGILRKEEGNDQAEGHESCSED